jgi:hypothetical protein
MISHTTYVMKHGRRYLKMSWKVEKKAQKCKLALIPLVISLANNIIYDLIGSSHDPQA